jgi:hypothetical protein
VSRAPLQAIALLLSSQAFAVKKLRSQPGLQSISFDDAGVLQAYALTRRWAGVEFLPSLQGSGASMQLQYFFKRGK